MPCPSNILATLTALLVTLTIPALATNILPPSNATLKACNESSSLSATPYPNKCQIGKIFDTLATGDFTTFFAHLSSDVHWTLMGTHPLAGKYTNRTVFAVDALQRLSATLDTTQPTTLELVNLVGGGTDEWSTVELHAKAVCLNGLVYDNMFSWTTRWNNDAVIVETHAYFDSALVTRVLLENESGVYTYTDERDALKVGPAGLNCKTGV